MASVDLKTLAERLDQAPMYPYFTYCHIIVCTLYVRTDIGAGSMYFSRKHPLACWISSLICIFSSTILSNFLLNEPVISAFGNTQQVLYATATWYFIFYSPFDIVYRICNFMPMKIALNCMNEVYNCNAINQGILHASKVFPDSYVIMAFIGIVRGNGPGFTRMLERLIRGSWSMNVLEFTHPSHSTKMSAIAAILFIVNRHSEWFMIAQPFVFFCIVSASIYLRLSAIILDMGDPFSPFENFICSLLFGGIWDALAKALSSEDQSRYANVDHLRAKALKANILSRNGRPGFTDKAVPLAAPQIAT